MAIENIEDYKQIGPNSLRPLVGKIVDGMNSFRELLNRNKIKDLNMAMAEVDKIWKDNPELKKMIEYRRLYESFLGQMEAYRDVADDTPGLKPIIQKKIEDFTLDPLAISQSLAKTVRGQPAKPGKKRVVPAISPRTALSEEAAFHREVDPFIFHEPGEKRKRKALFVVPIPGKKETK